MTGRGPGADKMSLPIPILRRFFAGVLGGGISLVKITNICFDVKIKIFKLFLK
jgi:hypothetical protein